MRKKVQSETDESDSEHEKNVSAESETDGSESGSDTDVGEETEQVTEKEPAHSDAGSETVSENEEEKEKEKENAAETENDDLSQDGSVSETETEPDSDADPAEPKPDDIDSGESASESEKSVDSETESDREKSDGDSETLSEEDDTVEGQDSGLISWVKGKVAKVRENHKRKKALKKEKKAAEKAMKAEIAERLLHPVVPYIPVHWFYQDLPLLSARLGLSTEKKHNVVEQAMVAMGICSKTDIDLRFGDEAGTGSEPRHVASLLEKDGVWKKMGSWGKTHFKRAPMGQIPPNVTGQVYLEFAIHLASPRAQFSGGAEKAIIDGQHIFCDEHARIDTLAAPSAVGTEGTGLKEDAYFLFLYTSINT